VIFFVIASLAINVINLVIFLANTLSARRPAPPHTTSSAINVLLPCRNEANRVTPTIESLLNQEQLTDWQLYILDDRSTDNTKSLINTLISKSTNSTLLSGSEIEVGWIGKSFALQQLYNSARTSEFTVLIDADVRLSKAAISQAIGTLQSSGLDFMSIYPRQITRSWSEYLVQPLLQWTWMTSLLLRYSERSSRRSTTVANGQFMVIRTSALTRIEGFSRVQNFVLDDIALARELKKEGFLGSVLNGVDLAECRMYENFTQLSQGYRKSLWSAFGSPIAAFAVGTLFAIAYILPLPLALLQQGWVAALSALSLAIALMIRYGVATITRAPRTSSLFHPLAILLLVALLALSWLDRARGTLSWSGRSLSEAR
jgi:cellulose synthase/poly-beta-1,6-N-acetylglucosamine synthase-like glycosyltransferase